MKSKHREEDVYEAVLLGELEITEEGQVWRVAKRGWDRWKMQVVTRACRRVRAEHNQGQYFTIRVMFERERFYALAHRLIWRHFNGLIPGDLTVNHKDGNKKNNCLGNLELASHSEQALHALHVLQVGRTDQNGEKNAMAKVTANEAMAIWSRRKSGESLKTIAEDFGITFQAVSKIAKGQRWSHLVFG